MKDFPTYKQLDAMDCGPTCLRMIAKYHGRSISLDYLRNKSEYGKSGVSMLGLADAAETIGLKSIGARLSFDQLIRDAPLPAILHWDQYHFVVLTPRSTSKKLVIADPAKGMITMPKEDFLKNWISDVYKRQGHNIRILLYPSKLSSRRIVNIYYRILIFHDITTNITDLTYTNIE